MYVYYNHEAKKEGNNVCLLMWKYLQSCGILDVENPIGELNWRFENCPGQNKNRMVVLFFVYLFKRVLFKKVNLIFLVKGHTMNICDRILNLLKLVYHNRHIHSTDKLMEMLNTHDQITDIKVNELTDFHDWDTLFEDF